MKSIHLNNISHVYNKPRDISPSFGEANVLRVKESIKENGKTDRWKNTEKSMTGNRNLLWRTGLWWWRSLRNPLTCYVQFGILWKMVVYFQPKPKAKESGTNNGKAQKPIKNRSRRGPIYFPFFLFPWMVEWCIFALINQDIIYLFYQVKC